MPSPSEFKFPAVFQNSLPKFLTPVFSCTSVSNLFFPSHFFLCNSFILCCWGRFKNEDPAAAYLEVQAETKLKCLNFRLEIFLQAWPNLSCPANDISLLSTYWILSGNSVLKQLPLSHMENELLNKY